MAREKKGLDFFVRCVAQKDKPSPWPSPPAHREATAAPTTATACVPARAQGVLRLRLRPRCERRPARRLHTAIELWRHGAGRGRAGHNGFEWKHQIERYYRLYFAIPFFFSVLRSSSNSKDEWMMFRATNCTACWLMDQHEYMYGRLLSACQIVQRHSNTPTHKQMLPAIDTECKMRN